MSNVPMLPDTAPSFLATLLANNPAVMAANEAALANMFGGMPPMIGVNGSRFFIKDGGNSTPVVDSKGNPVAVLGCVILTAKGPLEKKLYLSAYTPGSNEAPDCQSIDGVTPDAGCTQKQADSCAGCWANAFGSGVDQQGQPTKGKRCADIKKLALFANGKTYGYNVPPGSLQNFMTYVRDLSARQIPLPAVITTIGFDLAQPQIQTFSFAGMLTEQQLPQVFSLIETQDVKDIIEFKMPSGQKALAAPAPTQQAQPAPQPAAPAKANRAPAAAKTKAPLAAVPQPAAAQPDLGLGLGLDPVGASTEEISEVGEMSDGYIAGLLGLPG